jgi:ectoine hydroxylase-related dioxygenase (phytanoyl-CoA dioxygenase family)
MDIEQFKANGFAIINDIYEDTEREALISALLQKIPPKTHAIRQLVLQHQRLMEVIFNDSLRTVIHTFGGEDYFLTKSIYFNKPPQSNWFVAYHQDLSISVNKKINTDGYEKWTQKDGVWGVIPPRKVLENTFTVRIHIDDTDHTNGALRVIPSSHQNGILTSDQLDTHSEIICPVNAGGVMLMKPLLFHASSRSTSNRPRRVIHLEFSNQELPGTLDWAEKMKLPN